MQFKAQIKPENSNSLGVLAYLITANQQIHNLQEETLEEYLNFFSSCIADNPSLCALLDGADDAISLEMSLEALEREPYQVKMDILYMLFVLSAIDNAIERKEKEIIGRVISITRADADTIESIRKEAIADAEKIRNSSNSIFIRTKCRIDKKENWFIKLVKKIVAFFRHCFGIEQYDAMEKEGQLYKETIKRCAEIAQEDFSFIKPLYRDVEESCISAVSSIRKYRNSINRDTEEAETVAEILDDFIVGLNNKVLEKHRIAVESLDKKERTVSDFTISIIGRTKAGKTTLHSILTNQGFNKIGKGKQRTTRYNRVYQWNLLRMIDTPGIGSAEAAGRSDDEIAASVLGESDIICFVMADDSILKDVLDFIEHVAKLNKPIIVLLNHKENIKPLVKYEQFMENPYAWMEDTGESSLKGHVNRIIRYADSKGFGSLINVFPVFLYAAQLSSQEEYAEDSDILWDGSNINQFIKQLKEWIISAGLIKRSQTILDEAVQVFQNSVLDIETAKNCLAEQEKMLDRQKEDKGTRLDIASNQAICTTRRELETRFNILSKQDAYNFAEKVYYEKGDFGQKWEKYCKEIGLEKDIRDIVEEGINIYSEKANNIMQELLEDMYFSAMKTFRFSDINIPMQFDFKNGFKLLGSALGVFGAIALLALETNFVGWILTGVGALVGLGSLLIKPKAQRRQEAIDEIYKSISAAVSKQAPDTVKTIIYDMEKSFSDVNDSMIATIEKLQHGYQATAEIANNLIEKYKADIEKINRQYAFRILAFLAEKDSDDIVLSNEDILSVKRTDRTITIKTEKNITGNTDNLEGVISDRIVLERS